METTRTWPRGAPPQAFRSVGFGFGRHVIRDLNKEQVGFRLGSAAEQTCRRGRPSQAGGEAGPGPGSRGGGLSGAVTLRLRPENGKRSLGDLESCSRTRGSTTEAPAQRAWCAGGFAVRGPRRLLCQPRNNEAPSTFRWRGRSSPRVRYRTEGLDSHGRQRAFGPGGLGFRGCLRRV